VDVFSRQRVLELRQEIASLQHDNDLYRLRTRHSAENARLSDLRRLRLLAIKEELFKMVALRQEAFTKKSVV
jgi:hypothetical protein